MIGKLLFFLSAATATFLGLSAGAVTTSQNVDIIITHGAPLTTFTFVNNTGKTLPAGSPVSFGQAFRYGDVMPGTYPLIRDAATHVALSGQQWDEISTWRENGGNGSWRHAVWAAWLPSSLANGATYQVEFFTAPGAYSESSHQALSALCSGPAAHDLKIHLTDVRNQNDTLRDSGDATFRLCDNIANTGRDAARHLRAGNVYDEYQVNGMFVYATSGHKDPLLYAQCNVDIFTQASDGVSPGDVRWVCHMINAWENVAAGNTGNAGNPGPVGFANDPQTISYRPEIDDGASDVLDWSGLDATVASANNPIKTNAAAGCYPFGSYCMTVPSSTGTDTWYYGQAVRVSCTGTCVGGITNGQLLYVYPGGEWGTNDLNLATNVQLMQMPFDNDFMSNFLLTSSQGTGTTSFSYRVPHYHWSIWQTFDTSGQDNWSPFGTTTRVTRKVYPAFTAAEKLYWEETGLIIPLNLSQPTSDFRPAPGHAMGQYYEPFGRMNVEGFQGPGTRPDLGISSEWANEAFINGTQLNWDYARLFTLGTSTHGGGSIVNEATGRIPAINNGPPTGPGGNGNGGSYAGLGPPQNNVTLNRGGSCRSYLSGLADVPHDQPSANYPADLGQWVCGTYVSHMPSFNGFTYMIFGDRHWLDMMRWHANQDYAQQRNGPGPELGQGYYRDNNAVFPGDGNTYHYYGILTSCCQGRGSAWLKRDMVYPATFGGDSDIEKSYFNDFFVETRNYYPLFLTFKDGPGNTNYSTSITPPDDPGDSVLIEPFIGTYIFGSSYLMTTFLHEPLGGIFNSQYQKLYEGVVGGQMTGHPVSYYGIDYLYNTSVHDGRYVGGTSQQGNLGPGWNGTDASDFGSGLGTFTNILTGGQLSTSSYTISPGDTMMNMTTWYAFNHPLIDQMSSGGWYTILGPVVNDNVNNIHTFYIQCPVGHAVDSTCPVPGQAFTGFTIGGVPQNNVFNTFESKYRLSYDPGAGAGYSSPGYDQYGGQVINGLHILGYNVAHALADFAFRDGNGGYNPALPSNWWDPTVTIPGLPAPHNGL
jgi:hypothetical protein